MDGEPTENGGADALSRVPRSIVDEYQALWDEERSRCAPRPPRGNLDERELYDFLHQLTFELYRARRRARLNQGEVAASMGIAKSGVARLEGKVRYAPSVSTLLRYARAVGCDLEIRLVARENDPPVRG